MGKMLLILLLGMGALFTLTHQNIVQSNNRIVDSTVAKYYKLQAQNIAESGIEYAYNKIQTDTAWSGISSLAMANGTLKVSINAEPGLRIVTSKGSFASQGISRTVTARIRIVSTKTNDPLVPGQFALRNALTSGNDLTLNSGSRVQVDGDTLTNADVQTNGRLTVNNGSQVDGYGSYVTGVTLNQKETKLFTPRVTEAGVPLTNKTNPVNIPFLNVDTLKKKPYVKVAASGQKVFDLGTKENPVIWFVDGNLIFENGYKVSGYGGFVVKGEVNFNSGCKVTTPDNNLSNIAIFASGNVNLNSGTSVEATIFTNGSINFNSGSRLYGSAIARGTIINNSGARVNYRPALGSFTNKVLPKDPGSESKPIITVSMVEGSFGY